MGHSCSQNRGELNYHYQCQKWPWMAVVGFRLRFCPSIAFCARWTFQCVCWLCLCERASNRARRKRFHIEVKYMQFSLGEILNVEKSLRISERQREITHFMTTAILKCKIYNAKWTKKRKYFYSTTVIHIQWEKMLCISTQSKVKHKWVRKYIQEIKGLHVSNTGARKIEGTHKWNQTKSNKLATIRIL